MTAAGPRARCAALFICAITAALPLAAQQQTTSSDTRIQQLEQRLDELTKQVGEIRAEINQLKGHTAAAPQAPAEEDLTKITTTEAAPAEAQTKEALPPALTDVQTVTNVSNPGASKVFNPDTSVIGNFIGKAGQRNAFEFGSDPRPPFVLDEAEVAFEAFVDPYAKAKFFLSITPQGIDVEEGFANFVTMPYGLTAKVGKMKAFFGKDNTWHTHVRPWVDQPLVIHNFFGDEGLNDSGISVSKSIDNPWNTFIEATGEVFSGHVDNVFERSAHNDLFYNAHLKAFRDLTENSNIEAGTSYATGTLDNRHNRFGGVDFTYRWKPLQQGTYRGFIGRIEAITNDNPNSDHNLKGFYASGDYQLGQRWFAGARIDAAGNVASLGTDRGLSATLTFWPSEFSQLRTQLRRTKYFGTDKAITELLMQLQFAIGAHGAHAF
jgi:hypothetical protein